ncbi:MAG: DUF3306 domain-containing protein [Rhodobacteraceae bacterium]|nr:DUF3306 domain-containing protein [Paracoccaceae bacterium]
MSRDDQEDGFISRWSRRKRLVAEESVAEEEAAPAEAVLADAPAAPEEDTRSDAEILEELGLKDPDEMQPGDDFSAFMKAAVPEHLRRRALRKLWRSNPVLAVLDGLNDYDDDFTGDTVPLGQLKTAYQVGRGFVKDVLDQAEVEPVEATGEPDEAAEEEATFRAEMPEDSAPGETDNVSLAENADNGQNAADEISAENAPNPARKRMKFDFSGQA